MFRHFIRKIATNISRPAIMSEIKSGLLVAKNETKAVVPEAKPLSDLKNLDDFEFKEILSSLPEKKMIFVLCHNAVENKPAILILDRKPYPEDKNEMNECVKDLKLAHISDNDIHLCADAVLPEKFSIDKSIFIYPATDKHIEKYRSRPLHKIFETPEDYKKITLPFIESKPFSVDWVNNILEGKKDQHIILVKDDDPQTGFYLFKDLKWDGKTVENMYYQAVVVRRDLRSIRDLTDKELPLLENILSKSLKAIKEKHGVPESRMRIHFHYQPTYYHLHIHFRRIGSEANTPYVFLQTAIANIKMVPDYYQRATLGFVLKEETPLYKRYLEAGRI